MEGDLKNKTKNKKMEDDLKNKIKKKWKMT